MKLSQDEKAKKRLIRHIIGGSKQEYAETKGDACTDCGAKGVDLRPHEGITKICAGCAGL